LRKLCAHRRKAVKKASPQGAEQGLGAQNARRALVLRRLSAYRRIAERKTSIRSATSCKKLPLKRRGGFTAARVGFMLRFYGCAKSFAGKKVRVKLKLIYHLNLNRNTSGAQPASAFRL
jgi:hypothetical protein